VEEFPFLLRVRLLKKEPFHLFVRRSGVIDKIYVVPKKDNPEIEVQKEAIASLGKVCLHFLNKGNESHYVSSKFGSVVNFYIKPQEDKEICFKYSKLPGFYEEQLVAMIDGTKWKWDVNVKVEPYELLKMYLKNGEKGSIKIVSMGNVDTNYEIVIDGNVWKSDSIKPFSVKEYSYNVAGKHVVILRKKGEDILEGELEVFGSGVVEEEDENGENRLEAKGQGSGSLFLKGKEDNEKKGKGGLIGTKHPTGFFTLGSKPPLILGVLVVLLFGAAFFYREPIKRKVKVWLYRYF
jgi:hypothetical protein